MMQKLALWNMARALLFLPEDFTNNNKNYIINQLRGASESGYPHLKGDPLGLASKEVVGMMDYIFGVIYLLILYRIVREIK